MSGFINVLKFYGDEDNIADMLMTFRNPKYGYGTLSFDRLWCKCVSGVVADFPLIECKNISYESGYTYYKDNMIVFKTSNIVNDIVVRKLSLIYPSIKIEHMWINMLASNECGGVVYTNGKSTDVDFDEDDVLSTYKQVVKPIMIK